jgi:hypothetical protein
VRLRCAATMGVPHATVGALNFVACDDRQVDDHIDF